MGEWNGETATVLIIFSSFIVPADVTLSSLRIDTQIRRQPPLYHPNLVQVPQSTIKAYSAFVDDRPKFYGPAIYVLGIQLNKKWDTILYGKVVYANGSNICYGPSKVELPCGYKCNRYIHYTKYNTINHIFQLPHQINYTNLPKAIYLSRQKMCSDLSSEIQIYHYRPENKEEFGVCIQSPMYGNIVDKLVQFIELHRILGATSITLYSMINDLDKEGLLQSQHILDIIPWPKEFKRGYPVHYYGEILAIHDCLYRNMQRVKHLVFVDLDEVIIPRVANSWKNMLASLNDTDTHGYLFLNTYFVENKSATKGVIQKVNRTACDMDYITKVYRVACKYNPHRRSKFIVDPSTVNNLDIHAIASSNHIKIVTVPYSVGSMFHYRTQVTKDCEDTNLIYDPVISKFEQRLILSVRQAGLKMCY